MQAHQPRPDSASAKAANERAPARKTTAAAQVTAGTCSADARAQRHPQIVLPSMTSSALQCTPARAPPHSVIVTNIGNVKCPAALLVPAHVAAV